MKSLIRKYRTDRLLKELGVDSSTLVCDLNGNTLCTKNISTVLYTYAVRDMNLAVTIDPTFLDTSHHFNLVEKLYTRTVKTNFDTELEVNEVDEMEYGSNYLFPLYVFEMKPTESIPTGHIWHGMLKGQCAYGMSLWNDIQVQDMTVIPELGSVLAECADEFWHMVAENNQLHLLHPLAECCIEYGAGMYMPLLSASNFAIYDEELIPYTATASLEVYAAMMNKILYTTRRER